MPCWYFSLLLLVWVVTSVFEWIWNFQSGRSLFSPLFLKHQWQNSAQKRKRYFQPCHIFLSLMKSAVGKQEQRLYSIPDEICCSNENKYKMKTNKYNIRKKNKCIQENACHTILFYGPGKMCHHLAMNRRRGKKQKGNRAWQKWDRHYQSFLNRLAVMLL